VSTDLIGVDPCPYCGTTSRVKVITGTPPKVQAWSCLACRTEWAITVVNPHVRPLLEQLAEDVAARAVLREVIALRELAPTLTDRELRARLIRCLARLDQVCRHG
jgi:ribosomal protein L37AE/L43A